MPTTSPSYAGSLHITLRYDAWVARVPPRSSLALTVLCAALAFVETILAKMRVLLVPRLLAVGVVAALLGIAAWLVGVA